MPFVMVLPLIIIGIAIAVSRSAAEQKKRAEALRRAEERQREETSVEGQVSYTPVRPSVQVPTVRKAETAPKPVQPVQQAYRSPLAQPAQQMHPGHDFCALRPDDPKATNPQKHPDHDLCAIRPEDAKGKQPSAKQSVPAAECSGTPLNLTPQEILNGVIFSEILGKPKALR